MKKKSSKKEEHKDNVNEPGRHNISDDEYWGSCTNHLVPKATYFAYKNHL